MQLRPSDRSRATTWCWAGLALAVGLLYGPTFLAALFPPREIVSDFYQDWASARNLFEGLPAYAEHRVTIPRYIGEVDPICYRNEVNAHPPTAILLMVPLAGLGYREALLVWDLLSFGLFGLSLWLIGRQLGARPPGWAAFPAAVALLLCRPLLQQVIHGQLNLALLPLIVGAWAADRSGRPRLAGALVGAATAVKLFPGLIFLYFLARRRWSALLAGGVAFAALTGLTAAALGPSAYGDYARGVLPRLTPFRSSWFNASLVGFWTRLLDPATEAERVEPLWRGAAAARAAILLSAAAVASALALAAGRARTRAASDHAFGAAVTAALLLSPTTWDHGFLLLALPVILLWHDPPRTGPARALLLAALAALWFWQKPLCAAVIPGGPLGGMAGPLHSLTVLSYPCYALIALFGLGIARAASAAEVA